MMPFDKVLRLQAWVDGELSPSEARDVESWIQRDPEARAYADDLRQLISLVSRSEPERPVPEARESYWSRIARGIEQTDRAAAPHHARGGTRSAVVWWWRWLVPVGALAAIVISLPLLRTFPKGRDPGALAQGQETDRPIAGVNAFTFRAESERTTVVWVDFSTD